MGRRLRMVRSLEILQPQGTCARRSAKPLRVELVTFDASVSSTDASRVDLFLRARLTLRPDSAVL